MLIIDVITRDDIAAFVNGTADVEQASLVFDYLAENPWQAQRVGQAIKAKHEAQAQRHQHVQARLDAVSY